MFCELRAKVNTEISIHKIQQNSIEFHRAALMYSSRELSKINLDYFSFDGSQAHLLQTIKNWRENKVKLGVIT